MHPRIARLSWSGRAALAFTALGTIALLTPWFAQAPRAHHPGESSAFGLVLALVAASMALALLLSQLRESVSAIVAAFPLAWAAFALHAIATGEGSGEHYRLALGPLVAHASFAVAAACCVAAMWHSELRRWKTRAAASTAPRS